MHCNLLDLDNKLVVLDIEHVDDGKTIRHLDKMLKDRGSKHLAIVAIADGNIQTLNVEEAKRLLNHIIEQEEKQ